MIFNAPSCIFFVLFKLFTIDKYTFQNKIYEYSRKSALKDNIDERITKENKNLTYHLILLLINAWARVLCLDLLK